METPRQPLSTPPHPTEAPRRDEPTVVSPSHERLESRRSQPECDRVPSPLVSRLPRLFEDDEDASEEELAFLRHALTDPLPPGCDVLSVTIRAPSEALEKFLRLVPRSMGFLWHANEVRIAGGGQAVAIEASGEDRLPILREAAAKLWTRLHVRSPEGVDVKPVLFGGIAFVPGVAPLEPWSEFAKDSFTLARWTYRRVGADAFLSIAVREEERRDPGRVDAFLAEAQRLLRALETEAATSLIQRPDIPASAVHHISYGDWHAYMEAVLSAIRSGQYQKIVAARRCVVDLDFPLEDTGFMARLFAAYPDCTHFAVRRDHSTFLGATPETLFRKRGNSVATHALAGTSRVSDEPGSDSSLESAALKRSMKDLGEHALVVRLICEALKPISKRIKYSSAPQVRQVRNLVHLQTPISAELRPETHVFDLLSAFHPTPAVGGFPAREAAEWIKMNEPLERGWYTGTLGWFDAEGNAEFAVAIRCGVMTKTKAYIFAGAGIVEKSDPESEYRETAAKMFPILRALGVSI